MVREFKIDDLRGCAEMFKLAFNRPPWHDKWTNETAYTTLKEIADYPRFLGFTAWEDDTLVGFAFCYFRHNWRWDDLNLEIIGVSPEYHGRGYGRALMEAVEKCAKEHGCGNIVLHTSLTDPIFDFYKKNGFKHDENNACMSKWVKE